MKKRAPRLSIPSARALDAVNLLTLPEHEERVLLAEQQVFDAAKTVARLAMALAPTVEPAVSEIDRDDEPAVAIMRVAFRIVAGRDPWAN